VTDKWTTVPLGAIADVASIGVRQILESYTGRNFSKRVAVLLVVNGQAIDALIAGRYAVGGGSLSSGCNGLALRVQLPEVKLTEFNQECRNNLLSHVVRIFLVNDVIRIKVAGIQYIVPFRILDGFVL